MRDATQEATTAAVIRNLLEKADLLLAVNDPLVLNRENAKWLLYTAHQKPVPIIGFSQAYVRAGAAAAVFSEPEQMARQTLELLERWRNGNSSCLPGPEFTRNFKVTVNMDVSLSLGCINMNEDTPGNIIMEQEQRQ